MKKVFFSWSLCCCAFLLSRVFWLLHQSSWGSEDGGCTPYKANSWCFSKIPISSPSILPRFAFFFFHGSLSFSLFLFSLKPKVLESYSPPLHLHQPFQSCFPPCSPLSVHACLHAERSDMSSGCRQCLQQAPLLLLHAVKWTPSNQLPSQQHCLFCVWENAEEEMQQIEPLHPTDFRSSAFWLETVELN